MPKKGNMHQVKDVLDPDRRAQFQFYLQIIALMAKIEGMSTKNYSNLVASEKGHSIN